MIWWFWYQKMGFKMSPAKCCQLTQNDSNIVDTSFNKIFLNEHIKIYMVSSELCSVGIHQWSIDIGIVNGMALNRYQAIIYASSLVIFKVYINGLTQDCSNSSALAMELLQCCIKPLICASLHRWVKWVILFLLICGIYSFRWVTWNHNTSVQ